MDKEEFIEDLQGQYKEFANHIANMEAIIAEQAKERDAITLVLKLYEDGRLKTPQPEREPKYLRNKAFTLLKEIGHPLHYKQIFNILTALGVEIGGQNPESNLLAHLSQDSRFKSLGEGRWGLEMWPAENNQGGTTTIPSVVVPVRMANLVNSPRPDIRIEGR